MVNLCEDPGVGVGNGGVGYSVDDCVVSLLHGLSHKKWSIVKLET